MSYFWLFDRGVGWNLSLTGSLGGMPRTGCESFPFVEGVMRIKPQELPLLEGKV